MCNILSGCAIQYHSVQYTTWMCNILSKHAIHYYSVQYAISIKHSKNVQYNFTVFNIPSGYPKHHHVAQYSVSPECAVYHQKCAIYHPGVQYIILVCNTITVRNIRYGCAKHHYTKQLPPGCAKLHQDVQYVITVRNTCIPSRCAIQYQSMQCTIGMCNISSRCMIHHLDVQYTTPLKCAIHSLHRGVQHTIPCAIRLCNVPLHQGNSHSIKVCMITGQWGVQYAVPLKCAMCHGISVYNIRYGHILSEPL